MSNDRHLDWSEANQRYVVAAVACVGAALDRYAANEAALSEHDAVEALRTAANDLPATSTLETLCTIFRLSPFERDVLLLCAGMELDSSFPARCAAAQRNERRAHPTFSLALAALAEAHWSAVTPAAPLRRWRLIEVGSGESLTQSPLRIDERALHYLTGVSYLDDRLQGLLEPVQPASELPPSHLALVQRITEIWASSDGVKGWPVVQLCGAESSDMRSIAAAACTARAMPLFAMRAGDIPAAVTEREALVRLCEREGAMTGGALLLDWEELDDAGSRRARISFLEAIKSPLLVTARDPIRGSNRQMIRLDVRHPTPAEQKELWQAALGPSQPKNGQHLDRVVSQFRMGMESIQSVGLALRTNSSSAYRNGSQPENEADRLWDACREQSRARLDDLAQRIAPAASWDDLVLPEPQRATLRDIASHVRHQAKVYETWGFAAKCARGLGVSALFAGPSGTGKTMAGEVLANELRLDLFRIDLSQVVSKYIGETEKNLRRVFDAAELGGAILLFDEADALFGKRTEVKDSHDRYANIEVSYLLQRMEEYRGLAILTTNMKNSLDPAFLRRIRFVVQFPFPEAAERAEIWRRVFPNRTPKKGLDSERLARLNVAGGNIRNIALNAAFLAADERKPVGMAQILRAARAEYAKLEKPLTDSEVEGWV